MCSSAVSLLLSRASSELVLLSHGEVAFCKGAKVRHQANLSAIVVARVLFSGCAGVLSTRGLSDGQRGVVGQRASPNWHFCLHAELPFAKAQEGSSGSRHEWADCEVAQGSFSASSCNHVQVGLSVIPFVLLFSN